jgi:hypothetical protein
MWYNLITVLLRRQKREDLRFEASQGRDSSKILSETQNKRARGIAQGVEQLPSMHKTLSLNPSKNKAKQKSST